jgi:hypothetical protein
MDIHFAGWFVWDSEPLTVGRAEGMEWRQIRDKRTKENLSLENRYIEVKKTRLESGVHHESG